MNDQEFVATSDRESAREILRRERERRASLIANDLEKISEIYHDRLFYRHASGQIDDKGSFLKALVENARYVGIDATNEHVVVSGDASVSSAAERLLVRRVDGRDVTYHVVAINVWSREKDGRWRVLGRQATYAPENKGH